MIDTQIKNQPQKCPVCNGFGTVSSEKKICHSCQGRGWIVVSEISKSNIEEKLSDIKDYLEILNDSIKSIDMLYEKDIVPVLKKIMNDYE